MGSGSLYSNPEIYELAFGYRDLRAEVDTLLAWHGRVSRSSDTGHQRRQQAAFRVLELAAGPASHAIEFGRRGATVAALDNSVAMRRYAARRARAERVPLVVENGDMVDFDLGRRFDLVVLLGDSASHVHSLDDMVNHLRAVARHLSPHGVYVVEMAHPADFLTSAATTRNRWRVTHHGTTVDLTWRPGPAGIDPVSQVEENIVTVDVRRPGDASPERLSDSLRLRRWTATELDAAVRLAGRLEIAERHGSFDVDSTFAGRPDEWRMILVIRRRPRR